MSTHRIQVIERAAKILRIFAHEKNGLSIAEIAKKVELPRSTVHRIVKALAAENLLISVTPQAKVTLGPALIDLAQAVRFDIKTLIRPLLEEITSTTRETVDLSILKGNDGIFIDHVGGDQMLRAVVNVGDRFPLHATACGKALLMKADQDTRNLVLKQKLVAFTANTITDPDELLRDLAMYEKTQIVYNREELVDGVSGIAISFKGPQNLIYAISLPVPTPRFENNLDNLEASLLACRKKILALIDK